VILTHPSGGTGKPAGGGDAHGVALPPRQSALAVSPELRVVAAAIRAAFHRCTEGDRAAADPMVDWASVWQLSLTHGLLPLVYAGLRELEWPAPHEERARWRAGALGALLRQEVSVDPTRRQALAILSAGGWQPIVLKGAALATVAYPSAVQRTYSDVDLWLRPSEVAAASAALQAHGFTVRPDDPQPAHHLRPHYGPDGQVGVELHGQLLAPPHPYRLPEEEIRDRALTVDGPDGPLRVLAPSDALLLACLHLAFVHRYQWFPLRNLTDIFALATRNADRIDWPGLVELARRSRSAGAVYWPLWLSREWLGTDVPEAVLGALAPAAPVRRVVGLIADRGYALGSRPAPAQQVLYQILLDFSLYGGCSTREQALALVRGCFPSRAAVGHLPVQVTRSRLRYAAYLAHPRRVVHGLAALGQVIRRLLQS
jgi:hypothetical protein